MAQIRVEITTNQTEENTAYHHGVTVEDNPVMELCEVLTSVYTLYAAEGVTSIAFYIEEE